MYLSTKLKVKLYFLNFFFFKENKMNSNIDKIIENEEKSKIQIKCCQPIDKILNANDSVVFIDNDKIQGNEKIGNQNYSKKDDLKSNEYENKMVKELNKNKEHQSVLINKLNEAIKDKNAEIEKYKHMVKTFTDDSNHLKELSNYYTTFKEVLKKTVDENDILKIEKQKLEDNFKQNENSIINEKNYNNINEKEIQKLKKEYDDHINYFFMIIKKLRMKN